MSSSKDHSVFFSRASPNKEAHSSYLHQRSDFSSSPSPIDDKHRTGGVIASFLSPFYPGSTWLKRLRMTLALSAFSVNAFLNFIQIQLLSMAQELQNTVEYLAEPTFAFGIEGAAKLSTALETLESSRFSRIAETLGLPSSADVRNNIDTIRTHQSKLERSGQVLFVLNRLLLIVGWLLWAFIGYAAIWMLADVFLGSAPYFTLILLCGAIACNIIMWFWLHTILGAFIPVTF